MSRADARLAARREFGNVTLLEERSRDVWRWWHDRKLPRRSSLRLPPASQITRFHGRRGTHAGAGHRREHGRLQRGQRSRFFARCRFPNRTVWLRWRRSTRAGGPHPANLSYPNFFDFRRYNQVFEYIVCLSRQQFLAQRCWNTVCISAAQVVSADLFSLSKDSTRTGPWLLGRRREGRPPCRRAESCTLERAIQSATATSSVAR